MTHGECEEAIIRIHDSSESIIPRSQSRKKPKHPTGSLEGKDAADVGGGLGLEMGDSEEEVVHVEEEEEEEEGDVGF